MHLICCLCFALRSACDRQSSERFVRPRTNPYIRHTIETNNISSSYTTYYGCVYRTMFVCAHVCECVAVGSYGFIVICWTGILFSWENTVQQIRRVWFRGQTCWNHFIEYGFHLFLLLLMCLFDWKLIIFLFFSGFWRFVHFLRNKCFWWNLSIARD